MSADPFAAELDLATPIDSDCLVTIGLGAAITIPVGLWPLLSGLAPAYAVVSAVFLSGAGIAMLFGGYRHVAAELRAGPDGVRAGILVPRSYAWADIAGFEMGDPPWAARDAPGVMVLRNGHRVTLHALRETRSSLDPSTQPDVVDRGVRTLNRMLAETRSGAV